MAWKVIGFMHGRDRVGKLPPIYGPLPRKIWIRKIGERKSRMPKARNALIAKGARADEMTDRAKAAQYAFWLAKRDGIALPPDAYAIPHFESLRNPTTGKMEKRCMFVQMRVATKQAQRRAYDVRSTVPQSTIDLCRIDIPNWSWFPAEPVEVFDLELPLAA